MSLPAFDAKVLIGKYRNRTCSPEEQVFVEQWYDQIQDGDFDLPEDLAIKDLNDVWKKIVIVKQKKQSQKLKITIIIFIILSFTKLANAQTYSGCLIDNGMRNLLAQNLVIPSTNTPATFTGNCGTTVINYDGNPPSQLDYRSSTCYFNTNPTGPYNCGIFNIATSRNACGHIISNSTLANCPLDTEIWILLLVTGFIGFVFIRKIATEIHN